MRAALAIALTICGAVFGQSPAPQHFARSHTGMVASGSTYATAAGVKMLAAGGNAVDAAVATCFALMVTDPANTSLGGRVQAMIWLKDRRSIGIDGATQVPAALPARSDKQEAREGYSIVPVPGAPAALESMLHQYGVLSLTRTLEPAIELAQNGFAVPRRLAGTFATLRATLGKDQGAALNFLKPDGSTYGEGEVFRQPRLAALLRRMAKSGTGIIYSGAIAQSIADGVQSHGGSLRKSDLVEYRPEPGKLVRTHYRTFDIVTAGGRSWGDSLGEMLGILKFFEIGPGEATAAEVELIARTVAQSLADRPREGGVAPKIFESPSFFKDRSDLIRSHLSSALSGSVAHDTTHLSVMDAQGNAVALTTSIGPSFGARVANPELGFLYAHSYRMESGAIPGERDMTEMSPTIVFNDGKPVLTIGGAGSERIPSAVLQVISDVLDRRMPLEQAMKAPRVFLTREKLRLHAGFSPAVIEKLKGSGFQIENVPIGVALHLGLVHAVAIDPVSGEFAGAADLGDSGSAEFPDLGSRSPVR